MMDIIRLQTGLLGVNTYLVPLNDKQMFVVDPGGDASLIEKKIQEMGLIPVSCILTHAHPDHVGGLTDLKKSYPQMKIAAHVAECFLYGSGSLAKHIGTIPDLSRVILSQDLPPLNVTLNDGDVFWESDNGSWDVLHTPGHSKGCICLYNKNEKIMFTGDTIFYQGYGRTDLPGGSPRELQESLRYVTPFLQQTRIFPGHGEFDFIEFP